MKRKHVPGSLKNDAQAVMCASAAYAQVLSGDASHRMVRGGHLGIAAELGTLVNLVARVVTA
jgi:hypothetical protein